MNRTTNYRAQTKKSVSPAKSVSTAKSVSPAHTSSQLATTLYFCHYRNAMYMGGVKSFKKQGKGILLHDNGLSVICSHFNDLMHGHNIFYSQHCLLSSQYSKGKLMETVYRTDGYLAHLFFNGEQQLDGKCKLLNYTAKSITYAVFKKGILVQKYDETEFTVLNRVFDLGQYQLLIGREHHRAIKYEIQKENHIEGQKYGNKLAVGFEKGGLMNGLGFTLIFRGSHGGFNPDTHRNQDDFELKVVERGYMQNSQLNGFGEKLFKNGNLYVGEFKNGVFEGNGLLRNTAKKNWVSGFFQKGNLVDLFEYNNEGGQKRYDKIIQGLHERKSNWINNDIVLPSLDFFDKLIEKVMADLPSATIKSLEQRKQEVLRKIQQNFLCDHSNLVGIGEAFRKDLMQTDLKKTNKGQSLKHFVQTFIPQETTAKASQPKQNDSNSNSKVASSGKFAFSRKLGQDIRRSKIFDKSSSTDKYVRIDELDTSRKRSSRTPEQKKKIFSQTTTTGRKLQHRGLAEVNSPQNQSDDRKLKEQNYQSSALQVSEQQFSSSSKQQTPRVQKSARKSKIFNYLQDKSEQISPKFIYTKVDTIPEGEKRKRWGLEQAV